MEEATAVKIRIYMPHLRVESYNTSPWYFNLVYMSTNKKSGSNNAPIAPNDDVAPPPNHDMVFYILKVNSKFTPIGQ